MINNQENELIIWYEAITQKDKEKECFDKELIRYIVDVQVVNLYHKPNKP